VALVVLVGVPVLLLSVLAKPSSGTAAGSPGGSVSPSARPLSPDAYQQTLSTALSSLAAPFAKLATLHSGQAVGSWAFEAEGAFAIAGASLGRVAPSAAVTPAHKDLVAALGELAVALGNLASHGTARTVCAGSSALWEITTSAAADQVRAAVKELAGYTVPAFLPDPTPKLNRQLANGTVIKKNTQGANVLKVENKWQHDAVVSYAPANTGSAVVVVYVQGGGTATVSGVHDGVYDLYETNGEDWDADAKQFTRTCTYEKLSSPAQLKSNSRQYTIDTLTLGGGAGGDDRTTGTDADPGSFPF
jgi:hypothetical protein